MVVAGRTVAPRILGGTRTVVLSPSIDISLQLIGPLLQLLLVQVPRLLSLLYILLLLHHQLLFIPSHVIFWPMKSTDVLVQLRVRLPPE